MTRSAPKLLVLLVLLALLALLGAGFWAHHREDETRARLAPQVHLAQSLLALQQTAGTEGDSSPHLRVAIEDSLEQLAPAARQLATGSAPAASLTEQLDQTADTLLQAGLSTSSSQERGQALGSVVSIWQAAREDGLTQETYPPALAQRLPEVDRFTCQQPAGGGNSPALASLQEAIWQLDYVSEVYLARSEYGQVKQTAVSNAALASQLVEELTPVLLCSGQVPGPAATYPVAEPGAAAQQLADLREAIKENARAALADPALPADTDTLEAVLVKTVLDTATT